MKGDAVPILFSRRIKTKAKCSPIKIFPKKKVRKSPVKKSTSKINFSLSIAKDKTRVGAKMKSVKSSKQTSKFLNRASCGLSTSLRSRKAIPTVYDKKRNTNSLNASQTNLKSNKVSLKNLELSKNRKKVEKKKNHKKVIKNEKQSVRRSLRLLNSSFQLKENVKNDELNNSDLKPLKKGRPSQKKSTKQITTLSSNLVLLPNPEKSKYTSKEGRKKSAGLSTGLKNQSSLHITASKSPIVKPVPLRVNRSTRLSSNRESRRLLKGANKSKIINTEISLCTPSFHSLLETPQPENHSEKRKSSRLSESSPLRILNKELSFSTPASVLKINPDSTSNKSFKSRKSIDLLPPESQSRKKDKPKDDCTTSQKKQKRKGSQHQKILNSPKPLSHETENLPLDILKTPAFVPSCVRPKKYFSKSDSKDSKRKLTTSSKNQVTSEELQGDKKRKKSAGDDCMDTGTKPSNCTNMKKIKSSIKTNCTKKLKNNESCRIPLMSIQGNVDILSTDLFEKQSGERVRSVSCRGEIDCLAPTSNLIRKPIKKLIPYGVTLNVNNTNAIAVNANERKASAITTCPTKNLNGRKTLGVKLNSGPSMKDNHVATDSYKAKHRKTKSMPTKNTDRELVFDRKKVFLKKRSKIYSPINFTENVKLNTKSSVSNLKVQKQPSNITEQGSHETLEVNLKSNLLIKEDSLTTALYEAEQGREKPVFFKTTFPEKRFIKILEPIEFSPNNPHSGKEKLSQLPVDDLTIGDVASCSRNIDRVFINVLSPYCNSKKKTNSLPLQNENFNEINDFSKIPGKGTLKRKRWLLKNLEQNNGSYEDDIFENRYKPAFHFGDESDGSSVNIATPKFDCILTPSLPKKTPRFKDCISPTEFLQARKSAEEYLYRRNKKRKSGNRQSSSSTMDTSQNIPEKLKLDFTETVNKLVEVQKGLEIEAEIDDEEEDIYFSDASN